MVIQLTPLIINHLFVDVSLLKKYALIKIIHEMNKIGFEFDFKFEFVFEFGFEFEFELGLELG